MSKISMRNKIFFARYIAIFMRKGATSCWSDKAQIKRPGFVICGYLLLFFTLQDCVEWHQLVPPVGKDKAQFGFAVDFDRQAASSIAVSARRSDSEVGKKTGQVYLYSYDNSGQSWVLDDIVAPEDLAQDDEFGQSLAIDPANGSWLGVGADQSALSGIEKAGAAYILLRRGR